jgi:uncharacterized membrane protein
MSYLFWFLIGIPILTFLVCLAFNALVLGGVGIAWLTGIPQQMEADKQARETREMRESLERDLGPPNC